MVRIISAERVLCAFSFFCDIETEIERANEWIVLNRHSIQG